MTNQLNSLATPAAPLTMSTREIAELTGKRHDHVMRDFREVCEALELAESKFGSGYFDPNGQQRVMYVLPKDLATTLVSGYSIPMRHKIVMRWMELETKTPEPSAIPTNYRDLTQRSTRGRSGYMWEMNVGKPLIFESKKPL